MANVSQQFRRLSFLRIKEARQRLRRQIRAEGARDREVVFVSGVQRSGTNMLMEVLERSWETEVFMETDPRAYDNYLMRERPIIRRLVEASPSRTVVIKALCEAHEVAQLMADFAPARAIWMYRHYDDMINSNMVAWPGGRNQIEDIVRDRDSAGWRGRGMTDETHAIIRRHHRPEMNDASALGLFWYYRNQLFFDQGFDRNDRVMLVRYESMVTDPAKHVAAIARFAGIECRRSMVDLISPASVRKRPSPDIDGDVRALCDEMLARLDAVWRSRWEDYA